MKINYLNKQRTSPMDIRRMARVFVAAMVAILATPAMAQDRPNILIIWGDDIGQFTMSALTTSG